MNLTCYRCNGWPCECKDGQTIIHGDCREVLPLLPKVDAVISDPPYGISHKPVQIMEWCIESIGATGVILDPFLGSGTTLVACKNLGHKGIGIEIEEKYCEIAANRLRQEVLDFKPEPAEALA